MHNRSTTLTLVLASLVLPLVGVVSLANGAEAQKWTNTDGRSMTAEFLRVEGEVVVFRKGREEVEVPLKKLILDDRRRAIILQVASESSSTSDGASDGPGPFDGPRVRVEKLTDLRQWTDKNSKSITARFVRLADSHVFFKRGKRIEKLEFRNLSQGDQQFIRTMLISEGKAHLLKNLESGRSGSSVGSPGIGPGDSGGGDSDGTVTSYGSGDSDGTNGEGLEINGGFSADPSMPDLESLDELSADTSFSEEIELLDSGSADFDLEPDADANAMLYDDDESTGAEGESGGDLRDAEDMAFVKDVPQDDSRTDQFASWYGDSDEESEGSEAEEPKKKKARDRSENQQRNVMFAGLALLVGAAFLFIYWTHGK